MRSLRARRLRSSLRKYKWHPFGVNLVTPERRTEYGVGEQGVQVARAVSAGRICHRRVLAEVFERDGERHFRVTARNPYRVNLLTINGFDMWQFRRDVDPLFFEGRLTVVKWNLEVGPMPDWMILNLGLVDEIWVESDHVRSLIEPLSPVPVVKLTPSVSAVEATEIGRAELGLADGFLFLHIFDLNSSIERKNPLELIEAYKRAFAPDDGAALHLKIGNIDRRPDSLKLLEAAAEARPDIRLAGQHLSGEERDALINSCDCYVSLHRAEGFGYTMPEAMLAGKPVIATRYSGNLEYMTDDNSLLIDHELVQVGIDIDLYPAEGLWAQPDLDQAAESMRWAFEHQDEARRLGERAQRDAKAMFDPAVVGKAMKDHLRARVRVA